MTRRRTGRRSARLLAAPEMASEDNPADFDESRGTSNPDSKADPPEHYTVGYKRPPKHSQFKPSDPRFAQRRKRPKKTIGRILEDEFSRLRTVEENGQRRKYSSEELIIRRLVNAAIKGDLRAMKLLMEWRHRFQDSADTTFDNIGKDDAAILEAFLGSRGGS